MRTHWPRTPDARHVSNVRNRQHNTQRRYLLHLALIVLYRVLFFPILTSSNIPSKRACPRSPPLIIFLGPAECTTAHCPHRGCTLFIIHFDEYFDLYVIKPLSFVFLLLTTDMLTCLHTATSHSWYVYISFSYMHAI